MYFAKGDTMTWASLARYALAVLSYRRESAWRWLSIVARRRWRVVMLHRKPAPRSIAISTAPGQVILPTRGVNVYSLGPSGVYPTPDVVVRNNLFVRTQDTGAEAVALLKMMEETQAKAEAKALFMAMEAAEDAAYASEPVIPYRRPH